MKQPFHAHCAMRRGFTLVELLVVIAIIGILVAMLLPAVQAAREAARRTACLNHLVQLSLALQSYEAANEAFPPGSVNDSGKPVENLPPLPIGWIARILPQIESASAFEKVNFSLPADDPANRPVAELRLHVLICPSFAGTQAATSGVATTNYAGCHHDVEAPIATDNHGMLFLNYAVSLEEVRDGTSNTLLLGEKIHDEQDPGWLAGTTGSLRNTGTSIATPASLAPAPAGTAPPPPPPSYVGGFGSYHSGGANFAFVDGSVRFLSSGVQKQAFQHMAHRNDGHLPANN